MELGDSARGAGRLDAGGHEGVGALQRQSRLGGTGIGLQLGTDLRDVDRRVDFVVGIQIEADPTIAVDPFERRLDRGADADVARQVAANAEAAGREAIRDIACRIAHRHAVRSILERERIAVDVERGPLQRPCRDQAVFRVLIGLRMVAVEILRRRAVQDAGVEQRRRAIPIAAARRILAKAAGGDAGLAVIFTADDHVQAIVEEGLARSDLEQRILVIAIGGDPELRVRLDPLELLVGNEIDHAADSVRPIRRGGTAGDDVDALHQQLRKQADVGHAGDVGPHHALTVEQGQGTDRPEPPQRKRTQALLAARGAVRAGGRARRSLDRGQLRDRVEDVGLRILRDLLGTDDRGRRGCGIATRPDARAGDDDVGAGLRIGLVLAHGRLLDQRIRTGGIGRPRRRRQAVRGDRRIGGGHGRLRLRCTAGDERRSAAQQEPTQSRRGGMDGPSCNPGDHGISPFIVVVRPPDQGWAA